MLAESGQVWSCYSVLNVLYSLIQKSKIQDQVVAAQKGEDVECVLSPNWRVCDTD